MPVYCIECKSRRILSLCIDYIAIRDETKLYYCLKSVAYTQHEAIPLIKELLYRLTYFLISESCRKEFRGSVRLISCRKATGKHDYL